MKGSVFTRDFTRMYTSIAQDQPIEKVLKPLCEAFQWKHTSASIPFDDLRVVVKYAYNNDAAARFRHEGLSFSDIQDILKQVCTEVYSQQSADGCIFHQEWRPANGSQGLSQTRQSMLLRNRICIHRQTGSWRSIDEMLGFGEHKQGKDAYGIEHSDTAETRATPSTATSEAVFLGMRIRSDPTRIPLFAEPKGKGWPWLPQRCIDFASCHTHYTNIWQFSQRGGVKPVF